MAAFPWSGPDEVRLRRRSVFAVRLGLGIPTAENEQGASEDLTLRGIPLKNLAQRVDRDDG